MCSCIWHHHEPKIANVQPEKDIKLLINNQDLFNPVTAPACTSNASLKLLINSFSMQKQFWHSPKLVLFKLFLYSHSKIYPNIFIKCLNFIDQTLLKFFKSTIPFPTTLLVAICQMGTYSIPTISSIFYYRAYHKNFQL